MNHLKEILDIFIEKVNTSDEIKKSIRNSKLENYVKNNLYTACNNLINLKDELIDDYKFLELIHKLIGMENYAYFLEQQFLSKLKIADIYYKGIVESLD